MASLKAAVFDLDGVLIDSEPLWRRAEQQVFNALGLKLTEDMCRETTGLRTAEVVAYWYRRFPWTGERPQDVEQEILRTVEQLIVEEGRSFEGTGAILQGLKDAGLKLALASSSPRHVIDAAVRKLALGDFFAAVCSAVDEDHGKPHPAVYLRAAERLGVEPGECVAFEDSVPGVRAAKAAGMTVVAIPASEQYADSGFELADVKLKSLQLFDMEMIRGGMGAPARYQR
jgi:HAD superfamily hydrolase (TIGR01509 family)